MIFRVDWCAVLVGYFRDWTRRCSVCIDRDRKENGMDAPGFASPIRAYRQNLCRMRTSNDPSDSEPTTLDSLGVLDLDLCVCPDVFGLRVLAPVT